MWFLGRRTAPKSGRRKVSGVSLPRDLLAAVRRLDEYELRRLQILVRGLLLHADGPVESHEPDELTRVTYRQHLVRCGKEGCAGCPHGPYWYAHWTEDGRRRKQYVGRHLPGQPLEAVVVDRPPPSSNGHGQAPAGGEATQGD